MWADGGPRRGRQQPQRLRSTGLAALLDEQESESGVVVAASCMHDECSRSGLERTLAHVLDASGVGGVEAVSLVKQGRIDASGVRWCLRSRMGAMRGSEEAWSGGRAREGVFVGESPFGEGVVAMDSEGSCGDMRFDGRQLQVESQTIFSSARANACVWKGRWMYEATLGTAGIQQLGWATRSCPFTNEEGVGDAADSYAYDGKRVCKWSERQAAYGQAWVAGDVIGCCLDLERREIMFFRNGACLGVAYEGVRAAEAKDGYYPAVSLSHGERCELNFGGRPFKHPVQGFRAIQAPPGCAAEEGGARETEGACARAKFLLGCLQRLVQLGSREVAAAMAPAERLRRYAPLTEEEVSATGGEICELLVPLLVEEAGRGEGAGAEVAGEYAIWGALVPFLVETYRAEAPHDGPSVDAALELLLPRLERRVSGGGVVASIMEALAFGCRTSPWTLADHPYTGPYPFLAVACHLLERYEFMVRWWTWEGFDSCLEGLLTRKGPNKNDLEGLMPVVWWPGSREDMCSEGRMRHAATALSKAIVKVEELQWELCGRLLHFVPPASEEVAQPVPGVVFRRFLQNLVCKNRGANRSMAPAGLSDNSVLVSTYCVLLRLLSEGLGSAGKLSGEGTKGEGNGMGFLHRVGKRSFPVSIFLKDSSATDFARLGGTFSHLVKTFAVGLEVPEVEWEESCMDDGENVVRHGGKVKPACCSDVAASGSASDGKSPVRVASKMAAASTAGGVSERAGSPMSSSSTSGRSCEECVEEKASSSGRVDMRLEGGPVSRSYKRQGFKAIKELSEAIREEELLDVMLLVYHLGLAQNFKQASFFMQHQMQSIAQLEETDRQIRGELRGEKPSSEYVKRLKEARAVYREDLIDCVRKCTWYRVTMFARWKLRGMYATCMWLVQLLLVLSKRDPLFSFVPEFYVETLVDSFHALRRSDPPFVTPSCLLQQGLSPLVTFLVTHFSDGRIANSDVRDILLQSISVLVQYKEHMMAFERSQAAREGMVGCLLESFDNRFWIPVSNILLRLCKGSGFGASKCLAHGESFSPQFQRLLKEKCMSDEKLLASFLNRLFNTLNWTIMEFAVAIKEMQEHPGFLQVPDLQQRKCTIMFELSCNLERILEFLTQELPHAFLEGPEINLVRLCELIIFVLNHTTSSADAQFFDSVRQQGLFSEKINRAMILAPLVGIVLNLRNSSPSQIDGRACDMAEVLAGVDTSEALIANFQYLLDYSWDVTFKGDPSIRRISELKYFVLKLKAEAEQANREAFVSVNASSDLQGRFATMEREETCTICYAGEMDTMFLPCKHKSCQRCISRHLLNNQRCFFCNSTIVKLSSMLPTPGVEDDDQCGDDPSRTVAEALRDAKAPQLRRESPPRLHQR